MASAAPASSPAPGETPSERYSRVREASVGLAAPLAAEDQVVQTIPEVSPTKWHLAHVTWFFERFCLAEHDRGYRPFDERYHFLFNSYYQTAGAMHARAERGLLSRPTVADILLYRRHVDRALLRCLAEQPDNAELLFRVTLGLHHECQHQELLLTDIKHVLSVNPLGPRYRGLATPRPASAAPLGFVSRPGGIHEIGAADDTACFAFDNEKPRHRVLLGEHSLADRLITNGEYREFMADGGYATPELWLADGWAIVQRERWTRPLYWSEDGAREFTLGGWRELDLAAPVAHVSYYEADAFARWAGARLPREAEWELAAREAPPDGNLLESGHLQPVAAGAPSARDGAQAVRASAGPDAAAAAPAPPIAQLYGDVWEWTCSPYAPYPGFAPLAGSLGEYNGKFMVSQLVVRGGSCASAREHLRATYRSFFYPQDRWQFLGLRLAKGD